jgi:enoyl-CoA hydratase/carnithine racemase
MSDRVIIEVSEQVANVRLNRAQKHNAIDMKMFEALAEAADSIAADKSIRAVVLGAAGDNFCAGIDMGMFGAEVDFHGLLDATPATSPANVFQRSAYAWRELPIPVICALRGVVYGGGLQIALGADIRYASPETRLSIMEIKWGLIPDMAMTTTLRHIMPVDKVKELTFSGAVFDAEEALRYGVITAIHDDPLAAANTLAATIALKSPDAIRAAKRLVNSAWDLPEAEALRLEAALQKPLIGSPNQLESVMANMQKRQPDFRD